MKNNEIQNLKIQFEKDLKIKDLEYQIKLNNVENKYENKYKIYLEKELNELKNESKTLKSNNESLK